MNQFEEMMDSTNADLEGNEYFGRLAMERALNSDAPELLQLVITAGGDVNIDLGDGWTPMHHAMDLAIDGMIQNNRQSPYPEAMEMIRILVTNGADLAKRNREGKTPLDLINTYTGSEQGFNQLMAMFREVIPSLDERVQFERRR